MQKNILFGQFIEQDSLIHRLDPRTKLLGMVLMMVSFLALRTWVDYAAATAFALIVMGLSHISIWMYLRTLKPVWFILVFTWTYNAILTPGTTILWSWSFISLTAEGIETGTVVVWRIGLMILLASILTLTTKPLALALGLEKLLSSLSRLHVPVEQISLMVVIAIRFIPTIMEELERIMLAQKARGYDITALKLPKRLLAYIPIVVPLFMTTIQRAEQLSLAIDARAYGNGKGRSSYRVLRLTTTDFRAGGCTIGFIFVLLLLSGG
ncbi:energy-coupling factor transporter transmembrane component T family protein [Paenibacillus glucanolyticus]|uniref:energy-coupling factor transporter transmembrane component T family protein n=1 Tax=Paenibacillus glucanolyticus TaxID=59843 RepID=UPI0036C7B654